ncbi:MAG: hypothetical protein A2W25_15450 [candidate division Zixibacteria bacterium RBG_16_53_22]|nr:MAG: hypothetical protein A2W25_15450 [candidate division Zixibacteria bacterium RBG_16_53_22]
MTIDQTQIKTTYRHVYFNLGESGLWWCHSIKGDDDLGVVAVEERWKQYCFYPCGDTVQTSICLDDIADFLRQLNGKDIDKEPSD